MALDGHIGRLDGALLFAGAVTYTVMQIRQSRRESAAIRDQFDEGLTTARAPVAANLGLVAVGIGALVLGARWLVDSSVVFAQVMGVSELVIGLTIISAGTSLPEVATSVVAAIRGERDIAVGNVIGSNVFNLLSVLGMSALVSPAGIGVAPAVLAFDLPVMIAVAVACLPIFARGACIQRWEGAVFLFYYVAYTTYVVLAAQQHDALPAFGAVMSTFVIPITVLTIALVSWRHWRLPENRRLS